MFFTVPSKYDKKWGYELCIVNNDAYCGKILHFNKGAKFSMHFHALKHETWYVQRGFLKLNYINTDNAKRVEINLKQGDVIIVPPHTPHQLIALEESDVFEVSTPHKDSDSYRVEAGDSQS